ncbi:N-6 DNA methylase [Helicobacter sp. MIT 14-3879]|uniref:N-6 DNA methylase n=1 Tax=Helicobacter sp. MIT 14-3879 TaxID=2040649 RepID=UPI00216217AD|nr:N-6 DNA methylase [Helicobacter sp. MIT 14-3879]
MQEDLNQTLKEAIGQNYISFEGDFIVYHTKKPSKQNYKNPEEQVRAEIFAKLLLQKKYPLGHIGIEIPVKRGSENKSQKRADIIVYADDSHKKAYIVIELKKQNQRDLREAKEQALSYANFLRADYAQATNGKEKITLYIKDDGNDLIDDIPDYGGDAPLWKYERDSKDNNIQPITTIELKSLLQKIHNYLWNGGKRNPAEAFSEFSKIIFTKIMDEKIAQYDADYNKEYYEFQKNRDENKYGLEKRIKELYNRYKEKDKNVFDNSLILDADEIKFLVENLESINLSKTDLDIKGQVFQKFFADFFKGTAGQYFTPLNIVKFIVQCFEITKDDLVLDPSCGSGGFLLQTLQYMQEKSKKLKDKTSQHNFWHSFAEKNLYGIEISGGISQTAKMNMIIHDDGHTNVITADGLDSFENFIIKNNKFQRNTFDYIFTNPPFGSSIPSSKSYFENFDFAKSEVHFIDEIIDKKSNRDLESQKSEILFLERYFDFLKDNGIVACVLPDGILTNSSTQNVRDYLLERFYLLASFSLPQHTFSNYGAGVNQAF